MSARTLARRTGFQYSEETLKRLPLRVVVAFRPYVAVLGIAAGLISVWVCLCAA
jgi:hypothetical protein